MLYHTPFSNKTEASGFANHKDMSTILGQDNQNNAESILNYPLQLLEKKYNKKLRSLL